MIAFAYSADKPKLRLFRIAPGLRWACSCGCFREEGRLFFFNGEPVGTGHTPAEAYKNWLQQVQASAAERALRKALGWFPKWVKR